MPQKNLAPHTPRLLLNRLLAAAWQTRKSSGARRFQGQARRLTRLWAQGELESKSTLRPCFPRNRNTGYRIQAKEQRSSRAVAAKSKDKVLIS